MLEILPMSEWKEYRLGEIGEIITGKTPSVRNPEDWGNNFLFITPSDYCNYSKYAKDSIRKLSVSGLERLKKKVLPPKSILVTCIGSDMGKVVMNNVMCITNQQINAIVPYKEYDNDFVYYSLLNAYDTLRVLGGDGTAVPIVNKSDFENIVLKLPPIEEQKRIAGVLSSLDDKIDLLNRENATLEALAETLFRHYFTENSNPDWKEGKLGDVCSYITDKLETYGLTTMSYISTENMLNDKKGVAKSASIPDNVRVTRYEVGDVLLSNIRPYFKKIWLADRLGGCSNDVLCIRANGKELEYFVYYTLRQDDFFDYVMLGSKGCKMPRGDKQHIMNWPILIPDEETIIVFNRQVLPMIQKIQSNQQQVLSLSSQRDTLLPRLMSGEMKVGG